MNSQIKVTSEILMVLGISFLVPAFLFQLKRIYRGGKHTVGINHYSWILNYVGRYLWIPYSVLTYSNLADNKIDWTGIVMLFGQGIAALSCIPVIYYSFRNGQHGRYEKKEFKTNIFIIKIIMFIFTLTSMSIFVAYSLGAFKPFVLHPTGMFIFGLITASFTGIAFLPQTIKVIKSKVTKSISLPLVLLFTIGNSILIAYMIVRMIAAGPDWWKTIGSVGLVSISVILMSIQLIIKIKNYKTDRLTI